MCSPNPGNNRIKSDVMKLISSRHEVTVLSNLTEFIVKFHGPDYTPYAGGIWKVRVDLSERYPFKSPSIGFINRIFHPNIDEVSGTVCLDVINQTWSPMYDLINVFDAFLPQLLAYPNASDPLNGNAAALYIHKPEEFKQRVREYVLKYASGLIPDEQQSLLSQGDSEYSGIEPVHRAIETFLSGERDRDSDAVIPVVDTDVCTVVIGEDDIDDRLCHDRDLEVGPAQQFFSFTSDDYFPSASVETFEVDNMDAFSSSPPPVHIDIISTEAIEQQQSTNNGVATNNGCSGCLYDEQQFIGSSSNGTCNDIFDDYIEETSSIFIESSSSSSHMQEEVDEDDDVFLVDASLDDASLDDAFSPTLLPAHNSNPSHWPNTSQITNIINARRNSLIIPRRWTITIDDSKELLDKSHSATRSGDSDGLTPIILAARRRRCITMPCRADVSDESEMSDFDN
ncbi:hypothetical protein GJ496_009901 [Pomphorhynchus laevis]|nr:hypothetical protein GJ496_009901 [Pomphorhynchus laevis]